MRLPRMTTRRWMIVAIGAAYLWMIVVVPASATLSAPAPTDEQISCVISFVDFELQPWRNRLKGRLSPCGTGSGARGWIVAQEDLRGLFKHLTSETKLTVSPKVTFFEDSRVTFVAGSDPSNPTRLESLLGGRWVFSRDLTASSRIVLSATVTPQGTRLSVDLRDLISLAGQDDAKSNTKSETTHGESASGEILYNVSCHIPSGSCLLISMGSHDGHVGSKPVSFQRLAIITPQHILPEPVPR
jgi:hypothetical protein